VTVRTSVFEDSLSLGIAIIGSDASIEGTVVRRTGLEISNGGYGMGVAVEIDRDTGAPATLDLRSSLIDASREAGVLVVGCAATIASTIVRGTGDSFGGVYGDGVAAVSLYGPASVRLEGSELRSNKRANVAAFGAAAFLRSNLLDCAPIHLDAESYKGQDAAFTDEGDNRCGCGEATVECSVLSSMLEPPGALE
jgi:hypothetical protein